jgi:hypothetical protein
VLLYETFEGGARQLLTKPEQGVQCEMVLWFAKYLLGEGSNVLVDDGVALHAVGEEAMRPDRSITQMFGQLRANVSNASAEFWNVSVRAPIGSDVQVRVICTTVYGEKLPPITTKELTLVVNYHPLWHKRPPELVLPSQRGALNVFGEEYACANASCEHPVIELRALDPLEPDTRPAMDFSTVCYIDSRDEEHIMMTGSSIAKYNTIGFRSRAGLVTLDALSITNATYGKKMQFIVRCYADGIRHNLTKVPVITADVELLPVGVFVLQEPHQRENAHLNFSYQVYVNTPIVLDDPFYILEMRDRKGNIMTETEGITCDVTCIEPNVYLLGADTRQVFRSKVVFSGMSIVGEAVGKTVTLEFCCKFINGIEGEGPILLPIIQRNVTLSRCEVGYKPDHANKTLAARLAYDAHTNLQVSPATKCSKCAVTSFSEYGTQCESCPANALVNVEPLLISGNRAKEIDFILRMRHKRMHVLGRGDEVETWRALKMHTMQVGTFCRCEKGFFATEDPETRTIGGTGRDPREPSGIKCTKCPEGAFCNEIGITFDEIQADVGYWQIVEWFKEPDNQANLHFMACEDLGGGLSPCANVGRSSMNITNDTGTNTTCRPHHMGIFVSRALYSFAYLCLTNCYFSTSVLCLSARNSWRSLPQEGWNLRGL